MNAISLSDSVSDIMTKRILYIITIYLSAMLIVVVWKWVFEPTATNEQNHVLSFSGEDSMLRPREAEQEQSEHEERSESETREISVSADERSVTENPFDFDVNVTVTTESKRDISNRIVSYRTEPPDVSKLTLSELEKRKKYFICLLYRRFFDRWKGQK